MAFKIVWDKDGERTYETGVDRTVLYPKASDGTYEKGVAWNGVTAISESPSGAESTKYYADNIAYLNLVSEEEFGSTVEAYTYPDAFEACEGEIEVVPGVIASQQAHQGFGYTYRTLIGNDTNGKSHGYKIHTVYNAQAAPAEKSRNTVNDSTDVDPFSWEISTTPVIVSTVNPKTGKVLSPTAHVVVDSTKVSKEKLDALEAILYGSDTEEPRLPLPDEIFELMKDDKAEDAVG